MSEHGYKGSDFHKYCDNKAPTLILIKSKKSHAFGGFIPLYLGKEKNPRDKLNQTFVFSLENKKYNKIYKEEYAIRCINYEGPVFGDWDIKLGEDMRTFESFSGGNFFNKKKLEITGEEGGYESHETQEIEVFEMIYYI